MSFLQNINAAIENASKTEPGKVANDQSTDALISKTAGADDRMKKVAQDLVAAGRLIGHGHILELRKEAAAMLNKVSEDGMDGGHTTGDSSKVTEPGSVTDQANALPTNKDNPSKSKIDETKAVKHLTEADLKNPGKIEKAEGLVNAVSK